MLVLRSDGLKMIPTLLAGGFKNINGSKKIVQNVSVIW